MLKKLLTVFFRPGGISVNGKQTYFGFDVAVTSGIKTKITFLLFCLVLISSASTAQITIDTTHLNWSKIEDTTAIALVYNDADNGDGLNDGAMLIKAAATTPALQGIQYLLSGSPLAGEQINLESKYYQYGSSYAKFKMQVYDVTDSLVLAETSTIVTSSGVVGTATLSYTFTTSNVGDQIIVRFVHNDDLNPLRGVAIDYLKVDEHFISMQPPPAPLATFDVSHFNWSKIGDSTAITLVNTDADNGDGLNDGAMLLTGNTTPALQGIQYLLVGAPHAGEQINLESKYYQGTSSYAKFKMQVYDVTDSLVLAETAVITTSTGVVGTATLSYIFTASSAGDQIMVRFVRADDLNPLRVTALDYVKVNGQFIGMLPPPAPPVSFDVSNFNWSRIENSNPVSLAYTDADNGDGLNDGAMLVNGSASTPPLQGVQYLLSGTPFNGGQISLEVKYYQGSSSYAQFKMQVYDVTDSLVLAETGILTTSSGAVGTATLSHVFKTSSAGDQIMVRFVRAGDLSTLRIAALDYVKVNGQFVNMTVICQPTFNFDLPLTTASTSAINDMDTIHNRLSDLIVGTTAPTTAQLNTAVTQYNALNIAVSGYNITGNPITNVNQLGFLKTFACYLKFNPTDTSISNMAMKTVWYAASNNCGANSNPALTFYNYRYYALYAVFLNNYLPDNVKELFGNTLSTETNSFQYLFDPNYDFNTTQNGAISTDITYLDIAILLPYADWFQTNDEKVRFLKTVKRFIDRFLIYTYGTADGLKKDGLSYHHNNSYDSYMYAFGSVALALKSLEGTGFQIDQPTYLRFRDAVYAQTMYANDAGMKPLAMAGRSPQSKGSSLVSSTLSSLAITGGKILGLGGADPILAGIYNRKYGVDSLFNNSTVTPFEEGYIQFNYGNLGVYRKNNWIASMKGQSNQLWGSEIYSTQNRYGRYQSYGAMEIIYQGNSTTGNGFSDIGWDWNYNPGTTTIVLPWDKLQAEKERMDEYNTYGFAGSLALGQANKDVLSNTIGQSGLFAMKFKERTDLGFGAVYGPNTHDSSFEFTKTCFAIGNYIICLGSGIKNTDAADSTVTTLFQRLNNNSTDIIVNGDVNSSQSQASFSGSSPNWIIDNYNTGYFISPNSGTLKIRNTTQTTPYQSQVFPSAGTIASNSSNDYHLAYLDHGSTPTNSSYEFVCIPSANASTMTAFAQQMLSDSSKPYIVHQNNTSQQIIEHKASGTWAYALPAANDSIKDGLVRSNDTPCLVMYQGLNANATEIVLSVSNPDMGASPSTLKTISLTLNGKWKFSQTNVNASIVSATAASTTIQFTTSDGFPVEVKLATPAPPTISVTSPAANTGFSAPATVSITANAAGTDGNIVKVEFFAGATKLGEDSTAPYSFDWANVAAGNYSISAKASDDNGLTTTSDSVNISVNALPVVAITSPSNDTSVNASTTVTITANASDADGSIVKVEFFEGNNKLGEDSTVPYSFDWINVVAGNYSITAKATDNSGAITTSDSVGITVNALPTIAKSSPVSNTGVSLTESSYKFMVYPNPAKDQLYISLNSLYSKATIQIFSSTGQLVRSCPLVQKKQLLLLRELTAGTYLLVVTNGKDVFRKTIVKQ
ncbi:Ig-like domain-containing protein [Chitinophagaceae bacterium 26-R-25]|nr:Ig-like domain-containing protein [Chitinophagaceae bacterium 26-R-25]